MRFRLLALTAGALLALGTATAAPAQAAPAAPASGQAMTAVSNAATHTATDTATDTAPATGMLRDPGPECTGQGGGCWEYYSWYWTYSGCHDEGRQQLQNNPGRYNNYNCAGGHGLVVWLWLHRP